MKRISGYTKPFAVLGHPVGHSLSPVMHNAAFEALNMDALYLAFDVPPNRLMDVLESMRHMGFVGVNLTVPHKEIAFREFSDLDESAQLVRAVKTVHFTEDGMTGHNTDGHGFLKAVEEAFGEPVDGRSIFVLGTGGAGRAVALACAQHAVSGITLADLDEERAVKVAAEIEELNPLVDVTVAVEPSEQTRTASEADLVVQATPVGMKKDDPSLLGPDAFHENQCVYDLIYMYPQTRLLAVAAECGARTANGLGMLLHQGARAFAVWTGAEAPVDIMREALEKVVYEK